MPKNLISGMENTSVAFVNNQSNIISKPYIAAPYSDLSRVGDNMIISLMACDLFGIKTLGRVMGIILVADGIAE